VKLTAAAKLDMLFEVMDWQPITVDFVISSGVEKLVCLKLQNRRLQARVLPGVFWGWKSPKPVV
jgi:hypothetical protein